jgi:predicted house-cleaning noncanonical NTP pyrophosphatase (MazG superfamily)
MANQFRKPAKRTRRTSVRDLIPMNEVLLIANDGLVHLTSHRMNLGTVGAKAFGLSCLPEAWVLPHFVVNGSVIDDGRLQDWINLAIQESGLRGGVIVRSSGTSETMEHRGRLVSEVCSASEVVQTIRALSEKLRDDNPADVHWLIQEHVIPVRKGHLSNERRMSYEPRDWVVEFEPQGDFPGFTVSVPIRHWRVGDKVTDFDLDCTSGPGVTLKLKTVALWSTGFSSRLHFEWVWSGTKLWIVQVDLAKAPEGVNPQSLFPATLSSIAPTSLSLFRTAATADFAKFGKLRNARTYTQLGYTMPPFFVLDDHAAIESILSGTIPADLANDLSKMTHSPLMIRTDGINIPKTQREMLPRSDELRTDADAIDWLLGKFRTEITANSLQNSMLCLVAHQFIPSAAAAWARGEPGNRLVRVESLWGLPEGLYWYSHDTFEVDTKDAKDYGDVSQYLVSPRLRYKGTFVFSDSRGKWIPYNTAEPFDWRKSIRKKEWLLEIAKTTRQIADHDDRPTNVMWFIDNDARGTPHQVLPWYHERSQLGEPKAAPRRKLTTASDFAITTNSDWEMLQARVRAGQRVERITLEPRDPELIRNQEFAMALGQFAAKNKIVIELAGGVLSHAYYMLQRHGAQVECIDLFGAGEEIVEYNKLVRDKIPGAIKRKGESVEVVRLKGDALLSALRQKLVEEAFEALDAKSFDELIGELADVQEVINGICDALPASKEQVNAEQVDKHYRRGGFSQGFMLEKTASPHTLSPKTADRQAEALVSQSDIERVIDSAKHLPEGRVRFRPDLRTLDDGQENLLSFESELPKLSTLTASTTFEILLSESESGVFRLTVELTRNRLSVWGQARLRREPSQMKMHLVSENQLPLAFEAGVGDQEKEVAVGSSREDAKVRPPSIVVQPIARPKTPKRTKKPMTS